MFVNVFTPQPTINSAVFTIKLLPQLLQQCTIYLSCLLLLIFLVTVLFIQVTNNKATLKTIFNLLKYINTLVIGSIFFLVFLKFIIYIYNFKRYNLLVVTGSLTTMKLGFLSSSWTFNLNTSALSDIILLLALSSGLICIYLLGEKNLSKYMSNTSIFSIFLVAIIFMVYTTNLLIMFVGFEFLFLPTLYFVYSHGYVQRTDKAIRILLYWTLFGAFLVFSSIAYLYMRYKTLDYFTLMTLKFSTLEANILYFFLFLGFGVKVPVFPFHYWLTKIHVEAPAGFSIFLSGFLVKAAVYCLYYFNLVFQADISVQFASVAALFGIVESSIKMWTQTDFKKLIAFATIQEMNLILYLLLNYQNLLDYNLLLFILIHGWLSTLMFFLVDIIQKKTSSRNIVEISGLAYNFPEMKLIIWFILLLFSGFPLTVKFIIEWEILGSLMLQGKITYIMSFFVIVVVGVTGFAKQMIIILYGMPRRNSSKTYTLSKRDKYLLYFIMNILILLNILNFSLG